MSGKGYPTWSDRRVVSEYLGCDMKDVVALVVSDDLAGWPLFGDGHKSYAVVRTDTAGAQGRFDLWSAGRFERCRVWWRYPYSVYVLRR